MPLGQAIVLLDRAAIDRTHASNVPAEASDLVDGRAIRLDGILSPHRLLLGDAVLILKALNRLGYPNLQPGDLKLGGVQLFENRRSGSGYLFDRCRLFEALGPHLLQPVVCYRQLDSTFAEVILRFSQLALQLALRALRLGKSRTGELPLRELEYPLILSFS